MHCPISRLQLHAAMVSRRLPTGDLAANPGTEPIWGKRISWIYCMARRHPVAPRWVTALPAPPPTSSSRRCTAKFRTVLAAPTHSAHRLGTGKSGHGFWPRQLGFGGLFLVFIPKKRGAKHGSTQRAEQLSGGQSAVLVTEVPEQEGADGTPVPLGGGVCGPPYTTWPCRAPSGEATAPSAAPAQQSWEPPACAWASGRALCGTGTKRRRLCQDALYQITLPFSRLRHICSYCGRLPSTRVVVTKSLYLHKVILHVIKKKKLY